jgi:hypothetical protein
MGLIITKQINFKGINLNQIYIRLLYNMNLKSDNIRVIGTVYTSKEKYNEDLEKNSLDNNGLPFRPVFDLSYNRVDDGTDILTFIHNKVKDLFVSGLTERRYSYYKQDILSIDENGDIVLDENGDVVYEHRIGDILLDGLGNEVYDDVVIYQPFCTSSEITITDI